MAVNLSGIKTQFKAVLDTANTTTAAFDLSTGLNTRVQKVLKVNPARIEPQASFFPWVTIFVDKKDIEFATIAKDQVTAKRTGDIAFSVVGAVWETNFSEATEDEADENIEVLMENVEEVVRRNFKLNNTVDWSKCEDVTYHSLPLDEGVHMRVGVMTLRCRVQY
jgi:hypothetical protein